MKVLIFAIIIPIHLQASIYKVDSIESTFFHEIPNLGIKRTISFRGYTKHENIKNYLSDAMQSSETEIQEDMLLSSEIEEIKVIQFISGKAYNTEVGYIIKTKDGRYYIKYRSPTNNQFHSPVRPIGGDYLLERLTPERSLCVTDAFISLVHHEYISMLSKVHYMPLVPLHDFSPCEECSNFWSSQNQNMNANHYVWAMVEIFPETSMWQPSYNFLNIPMLQAHYTFLETLSLF